MPDGGIPGLFCRVFSITPCFMSLQEAKQFVAHFVTGDYTPAAYATFLQWLRGATVDEMNAIADEHEALHESWPMAAGGPSSLWVAELEKRLDAAVERR